MTWRSVLYCLLCLVAALVVASASCTTPAEVQSKAGEVKVPLAMQVLPPSVPVPEPARALALICGMAAIVLTYQQAWRNFRRQ